MLFRSTEVARRVENSLSTLSGLHHLRTTITDGRVSIAVEFVLEKKLSDAMASMKKDGTQKRLIDAMEKRVTR